MAKINLFFVRHGQTHLNHYHRIQGWSDSDLTDQGVQDAVAAGKQLQRISFDQAYSSDTKRASRTARIILEANPAPLTEPVQKFAFREENFGYFEGNDTGQTWNIVGGPHGCYSYADLIAKFGMEKTRDLIAAADPYGEAETDEQFWHRLQVGLDEIVALAEPGQNILIAAHGTLIKSVVSRFSNLNVADAILNGSVTKVTYNKDQFSVAYYNKKEH
ncbi:histidine phosphatase family protein [Fructilactobacillus myrtifloralis]|uniref:Histidine phosphatase family protein n=1 Tax=Fructilactobacillus myrtifloralis TaxID=2940301 RepID=A0ABY5BQD1_9LACO|nr:histidine phosphatase family protein [Fructilactobacillus myrtifloralis]USS85684.1 histidine phosphatase family protein [Fructilactobacillus myrtifloralis]